MRIVVIGNGAAAISGIEAFRKYDQGSSIVLVSPEKSPPYSRVLLPYFLQRRIQLNEIYYRPVEFYDQMKVKALLGHAVVEVDVLHRRLHLDKGRTVSFDKLLISSGSSPLTPPIPGVDHKGIRHLWTIEDAVRIDKDLGKAKRLLIVGGGFISLMLAWVAFLRNIKVTIVELMPHLMPQTLDKKAAELLESEIRKTGTQVLTGTVIEGIENGSKGSYRIHPSNRPGFDVDRVVVAAGVRPNTGFVDTDWIGVDQGILVNDRMETTAADIYAAGDVAQGPPALGGSPTIHALWTTALEHGKTAGANMAGEEVHYQGSLSSNASEFFHMTVASIGVLEESGGVTAKAYLDRKKRIYAKLFLDGTVPVGGLVLGRPEDVSSFGILKSYILRKKALPSIETMMASPVRPLSQWVDTDYHHGFVRQMLGEKIHENHFNRP